ncbi:hypothetical protein Q5752_004440 [Cryptotrichosporon argae]
MAARPLSLHERFSLARSNIGHPPHIAVLASFTAAPTHSQLAARVAALQARYPLVCARLAGARTRTPALVPGPPWVASEVVSDVSDADAGAATMTEDERAGRVLEYALARAHEARNAATASRETADAPLWTVLVVRPEAPEHPAAHPAKTYVVSIIHHVVADGVGALRLLSALIAPAIALDDDAASAFPPDAFDVPTLDSTMSLKPGARTLVPASFAHLIVPRLPAFARAYFAPPTWPTASVVGIEDAPGRVLVISIGRAAVAGLKEAGRKAGVATLHPTLEAAATVAVRSVLVSDTDADAAAGPGPALKVSTPISERDPALGHGWATANYVSASTSTYALADVPRAAGAATVDAAAAAAIWALARRIVYTLASPSARRAARESVGMLAYIPDAERPAEPQPEATSDERAPTGWEAYLLARLAAPQPFGASLEVSNLGHARVHGADAVCWAQPSMAPGPPVSFNVVGHERGLSVSVTFREGACVTTEQAREVGQVFKNVVEALARA